MTLKFLQNKAAVAILRIVMLFSQQINTEQFNANLRKKIISSNKLKYSRDLTEKARIKLSFKLNSWQVIL